MVSNGTMICVNFFDSPILFVVEDHQTPEGSAATSPFLNIPASPDPGITVYIRKEFMRSFYLCVF